MILDRGFRHKRAFGLGRKRFDFIGQFQKFICLSFNIFRFSPVDNFGEGGLK